MRATLRLRLLNLRSVAALPALLAKFYESCGAKIKFTATPYPSATRKSRLIQNISRVVATARNEICALPLKEFAMKFLNLR